MTTTTTTSWNDFPDTVWFHIVEFLASPTYRITAICHILAPLCRAFHQRLVHNSDGLWRIVLRQDYPNAYGTASNNNDNVHRRTSKRVQQQYNTVRQQVQAAHENVLENTETAFFNLAHPPRGLRLTTSRSFWRVNNDSRPSCLSLTHLRRLLSTAGVSLRINSRTTTGGVFLVEVCRARRVKESVIFACVKELVTRHKADVNVQSYESPNSYETALCVAATRGMPTVVSYLLSHNANPNIRCAGRFRIGDGGRRTSATTNHTYRKDVTPLQYAQAMLQAEEQQQWGIVSAATQAHTRGLKACIALLEKAVQTS
jgi:hypothetical protein